ncbi:hypothetical protein LEP1GSC188_0686 [Leptospira weilii serovar Topaz str. LT2116]|uniref:Uncharacterized protein n=1 Tax=Leptospira weilii serovar Topaz str. LT2116 TaxID=1088540 RepID=M3GRE8_9LEPT|nr:hypothetical protein LEP1GSC188_0686 [Leptospira weilii serovar Topaz str. LT2116]
MSVQSLSQNFDKNIITNFSQNEGVPTFLSFGASSKFFKTGTDKKSSMSFFRSGMELSNVFK